MHFINTSQIIIFIGILCATLNSPVFAMPARNVTGGIIAARQDDPVGDSIFATRTKSMITRVSTKRPGPTDCGPNMKRQEGDGTGLRIVPVCD